MNAFRILSKHVIAASAAACFAVLSAAAQTGPAAGPAKPAIPGAAIAAVSPFVGSVAFAGETSERSIKVDAGVNVSVCVSQGDLRVNGWNRNEARVFVQNGTKFGFSVQQKSPKTNEPVWIKVVGESSADPKDEPQGECIRGDQIEIDLPVSSALNLKGQEITTTIDSIRKANIRNAGGDITVTNITGGVTATTYRGDLSVEDSAGSMTLESTNGNIVVSDAGPSEIGDILRAKTNSGAIVLQKVAHRQIEVNSISGTVAFNSELLSGGSYSFSTLNGSIRLSLPNTSSFTIMASYGFGSFSTDLPIKVLTEDIHPGRVMSVNGKLGTGEAAIRITTSNGSISIRKL
jgi:hypothetical protein